MSNTTLLSLARQFKKANETQYNEITIEACVHEPQALTDNDLRVVLRAQRKERFLTAVYRVLKASGGCIITQWCSSGGEKQQVYRQRASDVAYQLSISGSGPLVPACHVSADQC